MLKIALYSPAWVYLCYFKFAHKLLEYRSCNYWNTEVVGLFSYKHIFKYFTKNLWPQKYGIDSLNSVDWYKVKGLGWFLIVFDLNTDHNALGSQRVSMWLVWLLSYLFMQYIRWKWWFIIIRELLCVIVWKHIDLDCIGHHPSQLVWNLIVVGRQKRQVMYQPIKHVLLC